MQLLRDPSPRQLEKFLEKNKLSSSTILHWTGSMWGIGCRASSLEAIARIQKLKQRPEGLGFIALIPGMSVLDETQIPLSLKPLMQQYWPGNLSIVFPYQDPRLEAISVQGKVSFRVPSDPLLRSFISYLGEPLISTSINISGLVPEEDLGRIERIYASWFDFGLIPARKNIRTVTEHSTIIAYQRVGEAGFSGNSDELKCLREGSVPFYEIKKSFKLPLITFVCTANICRSPIAAYLFRKMLNDRHLPYATDSCGVQAYPHEISLASLQLLMEQGITEAQAHVAKQITPQIVSSSWLVLAMEEWQRDTIRAENPHAANKIFTLNEIVGESGDIADPMGSEPDYYRIIYLQIEDRLNRLLDKLTNGTLYPKENQ